MYLKYFDKFYDQDGYLDISEEEWTYIKETFEKDDVKESLAKVAMTYPIPYAEISEEVCLKDYKKLKGIWWNDLIIEDEWFARSEDGYRWGIDYKGKQIYFKRYNVGNKSSNYFQQKNRWSVDGSVSPGPQRTWETEKFMTSLMGAAYSLKLPKIDKKHLRLMIGLRKYICSQFKPSVAKAIYDYFEADSILDFSAGWGDRLAGFYASNSSRYYGIDPRKENHPIYREQAEFYEKHRSTFLEPTKEVDFFESPAEDFDYSQIKPVDLVFTSPPYFNVERYSYDDTQSWIRYKDINSWNESFLHRALEKMWTRISSGGHLLVNISDVYSNSKWSTDRGWDKICDPMNDFINNELEGSEYQGCIGKEMAKRPNSGGAGTAKSEEYSEESLKLAEETKNKTFCEPIWVWKKL